MLQEFVFKASGEANPLVRFTAGDEDRWALIELFRDTARSTGRRALFILHAPKRETERFLAGDFGRRYGTYEILHQEEDVASVEVSNYVMPSYRGMDPVDMAIRFLGPDVLFEPILVHGGYFHVKLLAAPRSGSAFHEMARRMASVTNPSDFKLVHSGQWDPVRRLAPSNDGLSTRQAETLRMAIDLGYYDQPRRCTLQELADSFGISKAAVHKRLQAAECRTIKAAY